MVIEVPKVDVGCPKALQSSHACLDCILMPGRAYVHWRGHAPHHLQVEVVGHEPKGWGDLEKIHVRVVRVFSTTHGIEPGDRLEFTLSTYRSEERPVGGRYVHIDRIQTLHFLEVFLLGKPPLCKIVAERSQYYEIDGPTETPTVPRPTREELARADAALSTGGWMRQL